MWLRHPFATSRDNAVDHLEWQKCARRTVKAWDISNFECESIRYLEMSETSYPVLRVYIAEVRMSQMDVTAKVIKK